MTGRAMADGATAGPAMAGRAMTGRTTAGRVRPWLLAALLAALPLGCGAPRSAGGPEVRPATVEQLLTVVQAPGARVVLLNVWATWCIPCREEFPDLLRIEREYRGRGLRLVLVSGDFDTELPAVKRFLATQKVDFLTYLKQGADMPFIDGLDPRWSGALPATLLYDGAGRRVWFHEGKVAYDTLKTRIETMLAAQPEPAP